MNLRSPSRGAPQKLRERLREATTGAILGAAERVFAKSGLHAARMEAIAAEAGVAVGTLYNHFEDREALLTSLVNARRKELLEQLEGALADGEDEKFEAQLRGFVEVLLQHLEAHQAFLTILTESDTSHLAPKTGKSRETAEQIYARAVQLVQRGVSQKAIRKDDADLLPTLLMGMVKGCMMRRMYEDERSTSIERRTAQLVRFFLKGAST